MSERAKLAAELDKAAHEAGRGWAYFDMVTRAAIELRKEPPQYNKYEEHLHRQIDEMRHRILTGEWPDAPEDLRASTVPPHDGAPHD